MITDPSRIYLDNAATSWPKPCSVYEATDHFQRQLGANAGRGAYRSAIQASAIVEQARAAVRKLFHPPSDYEICFGANATDVLNVALHGWLQGPAHVITSVVEHNSILRPLCFLGEKLGVDISYVPCDGCGRIDPAQVRAAIRSDTRLIALTSASNVTGCLQPLEELAVLAREREICLMIDAAQSAGHVPLDLTQTPIDILATSGHKGLLGPLGTGVLCLSQRAFREMAPFRQGGTGSHSDQEWHPVHGPEKFEAGSANLPGLAGLRAGLNYVLEHLQDIRAHEIRLVEQLLLGLRQLPGVEVLGPRSAVDRVGVVSFTAEAWDCHDLANALDVSANIEVRSGLMCAPRLHAFLGRPQGTVRASVGPFTTEEHVAKLIDHLGEILR